MVSSPALGISQREIIRETRFRLNRGQSLFSAVVIASLLVFAFSTFQTSKDSLSQAQLLSSAEAPAASIIFTQRESLVYATRYSEWLAGGIPRRDVQIARAMLAQRLNVIDGLGSSIGSRLTPEFLQSLHDSDQILAATHSGYLLASERSAIAMKSAPVIDAIVQNARQLIESYQHAVDNQIHSQVLSRARSARINLGLLMWVIISGLILLIWVGSTVRGQYRRGRMAIQRESRAMELVRDELLRTQESLVAMQSLNEAKNEFISTINHELRTPLTSIIGYIELIRKRLKIKEVHEIEPLVDTLDRNALSLLDLVESMLTISRLDSREPVVDFQKIDLAELVANLLFVLQPSIDEKDIQVTYQVRKDEFIIDGNYGQISQVFMNLLANAIKFSHPKGEISIDFFNEVGIGGERLISATIGDQGIGIATEDMAHLFTRFFRGKNAVANHIPGTGLGLAIVEKIILIHGGTISAKSELGIGTKFHLSFPAPLSKVDQMISKRAKGVIERSISRIESAEDVAAATHEIGGAIGFYNFEKAGDQILELSRAVNEKSDIESVRHEALTILRSVLTEIENEELECKES